MEEKKSELIQRKLNRTPAKKGGGEMSNQSVTHIIYFYMIQSSTTPAENTVGSIVTAD